MESQVAENWNAHPDIYETRPLDTNDRACLDAIRDVLEKHGCLDRFGVNLLHKHFDLADDEIMIEQVDENARKLLVKPVKTEIVRSDMPNAYETQWHWQRNASGEVSRQCNLRCFPGNWQSPQHVQNHVGW